jgi:hypothetical protein
MVDGTVCYRCGYLAMKTPPTISEKKAAVLIWIGAALFTVGAMFFGH